jgi:hypothetical protein
MFTTLFFYRSTAQHIYKGPVDSEQNNSSKGNFSLGGGLTYVDFEGLNPKMGLEVVCEYMLTKHIGSNFPIAAGPNYAHVGLGILGAAGIAASRDPLGKGNFFLMLFTPFLIENMSFHIPISKRAELVPYYSLLRVRYNWDEINSSYRGSHASGSMGLKLITFSDSNWNFSMYAEASQLYMSGHPYGFQSGISMFHIFKHPKL